jgi:hypothetical protein
MWRTFALALALVGIPTLGLLVTETTVPDGLARYEGDRERLSVARAALHGAIQLNDAPVARLLYPAARVESVEHELGSCPADEPGIDQHLADYTARVRIFTWFRIPAKTVEVWCGGGRYGPIPAARDTIPRIAVDKSTSMQMPLPAVQVASAHADLDADGALEELEIRADVELDAGGRPMWEDGHRWVALVRDGTDEHRLVDEFVPQGTLTAWVVESGEGIPTIVVLRESGTSGVEVRAFRADGSGGYARSKSLGEEGRLSVRLEAD